MRAGALRGSARAWDGCGAEEAAVGLACPAQSWGHPLSSHLPTVGPTPHSCLSLLQAAWRRGHCQADSVFSALWSLSFPLGPMHSWRGSPL